MAENISQTNSPGRWQALYDQWIQENRPGWVVSSKTTYLVLRLPNDEIQFKPMDAESLYESTSF